MALNSEDSLRKIALLHDPSFYANEPHHTFARLRAEAPIFWNESIGFWAVTRFRDIQYIMRHPEQFSSNDDQQIESWVNHREQLFRFSDKSSVPPPGAMNLITTDPPLHGQYKKLVMQTGMFGPRAAPGTDEQIQNFIRSKLIRSGTIATGEIDEIISAPLATAMIGYFLGIPESEHDRMQILTEAIEPLAGVESLEARDEAAKAMHEMWDTLVDFIETSEEGTTLGRLRDAQRDSEVIDHDSLLAFLCDVIVAGIESTRTAITGAFVVLAEHQEQWSKLQQNRELIPNAVEEVFRWVTPAASMGRVAREETQLAGTTISEGDRILLLFAAANRDETIWNDAHRFDIARPVKPTHLSFGHGAHLCVGVGLARLTLRLLFEEFSQSGVSFRLTEPPMRHPGFNATAQFSSAQIAIHRIHPGT